MLRLLPASARASLTWARKPIADTIRRLRTEPLTDDLLAGVAQDFNEPMRAISSAVWRTLADSPESLRSALMTDIAKEEAALVGFLDDEDSRDTVSWVTGFLRSFYSSLALVGPPELTAALENGFEHADDSPEWNCFTRGLATLMAAAEEVRLGGDVQRTMDLVDCAFLQFNEFRDQLRQHGIDLSPFPEETSERRRDRLRFAIEQLRSSFSNDDWRVLSEARVADFR